jgi:lysyl-tRNA synthetase class 2
VGDNEPNSEILNNSEDLSELLRIRREKLSNLQNINKDPFLQVKYDVTHHSTDIHNNYDSMENSTVSAAGRMMSKRIMGKASFCDVQDREGRIQVYVAKNETGDEAYEEFKHYDIGDIVGVKGIVFKTRTGEISIKAEEITLLSKSLQILPEKFHGLKDQDTRYRQRYLDLIVNPEVKDTFLKRTKIIKSMRKTLDDLGYIEVETPVLQLIPGGGEARPFSTHYNALDMGIDMRISHELPLKQLIVGGLE